jgi:DNA processing protein
VVSEYPALGKAKPENFLFRNRLLVGLSETVFVGGGKNRSGTSSSVRIAIENNKEIMALPCNITGDDLTNSLIADGARSVLCAKDIVECLKEKLY